MNNITFEELYEYIKENCDGDYNLLSYLDGFIANMMENSLYHAIFSWSENEVFEISINENPNSITYDVIKLKNTSSFGKEKPFFKFELNGVDVFYLSAILSAVAYKQGRVFEEFGSDADRLILNLIMPSEKFIKNMN